MTISSPKFLTKARVVSLSSFPNAHFTTSWSWKRFCTKYAAISFSLTATSRTARDRFASPQKSTTILPRRTFGATTTIPRGKLHDIPELFELIVSQLSEPPQPHPLSSLPCSGRVGFIATEHSLRTTLLLLHCRRRRWVVMLYLFFSLQAPWVGHSLFLSFLTHHSLSTPSRSFTFIDISSPFYVIFYA